MTHVRLGQHILCDDSIAESIVDAVDISAGNTIVEIGPGTGALTRHIVARADSVGARVLLVEVDEQLARDIERAFGTCGHVEVVRADARQLDVTPLIGTAKSGGYKVVGNLPYYAGTPIVRRFLECEAKPETMTVMLQREVAVKMVAAPGRMSLVSLAIQIYATGELMCNVEPACFRPPPKVLSSVVQLLPLTCPAVEPHLIDAVFRVARVSFRGNRKQLHNSLSVGLGLSVEECKVLGARAGVDTSRRPATLAVREWRNLAQAWLATYSAAQVQVK